MPSNGTAPYQYSIDNLNYQLDSVFLGLNAGLYTLYCVDANGCVVERPVDLCTVSAQEPFQARALKISPNPTSGMANIELTALDSEQSVLCEVFDARGRFVQAVRLVRWDDTLRGMVILDKQAAGVYFLKINGLARPLMARIVKK